MLTTPVARVDLTSDVIWSDECRPSLALFDRSSTPGARWYLGPGYLHRRRESRMRELAFLQLLSPLKSRFLVLFTRLARPAAEPKFHRVRRVNLSSSLKFVYIVYRRFTTRKLILSVVGRKMRKEEMRLEAASLVWKLLKSEKCVSFLSFASRFRYFF